MSISNAELVQIFSLVGVKLPLTGGPAGTLKSAIAQTMPYDFCGTVTPTQANMILTPIYVTQGQVITSINMVTVGAATTPTHTWWALYDDGRGSSTANQLALLGQSADQAAGAIGANTNLGLALLSPYTTTYTGIYYVAWYNSGTTAPTMAGFAITSTASIQIAGAATGALYRGTIAVTATAAAPNPSGAVSAGTIGIFAYIS